MKLIDRWDSIVLRLTQKYGTHGAWDRIALASTAVMLGRFDVVSDLVREEETPP